MSRPYSHSNQIYQVYVLLLEVMPAQRPDIRSIHLQYQHFGGSYLGRLHGVSVFALLQSLHSLGSHTLDVLSHFRQFLLVFQFALTMLGDSIKFGSDFLAHGLKRFGLDRGGKTHSQIFVNGTGGCHQSEKQD